MVGLMGGLTGTVAPGPLSRAKIIESHTIFGLRDSFTITLQFRERYLPMI